MTWSVEPEDDALNQLLAEWAAGYRLTAAQAAAARDGVAGAGRRAAACPRPGP
jgi:hypothetical protein